MTSKSNSECNNLQMAANKVISEQAKNSSGYYCLIIATITTSLDKFIYTQSFLQALYLFLSVPLLIALVSAVTATINYIFERDYKNYFRSTTRVIAIYFTIVATVHIISFMFL